MLCMNLHLCGGASVYENTVLRTILAESGGLRLPAENPGEHVIMQVGTQLRNVN